MSRSAWRAVAPALLLPLALLPLAACAGGDPQAGMQSAEGVALRAVAPDAAAALPSVVGATRRLGTTMLADAPVGDNVVTSPSSLAVALGMLAEGARGRTLAELEAVLGASGAERKDAFAALRGALASMDGDPAVVKKDELPETPVVHLADQVVVDDGYPVSADYLTALAEDFGAGVQKVDLGSADGKRVLDAWVNHHTGGLVEKSAIEPDPYLRVVLQDAIVLAARWEEPFPRGGTAPRPFTLTDGTLVDTETMAMVRELAYAEVDGWQAVRLSYIGGKLHADLVLPPAGTDPASVTPELLGKVSGALDHASPAQVEVTLPTLAVKPDALELQRALAKVGAVHLWCKTEPDLTGIGPEDLCVSQAVQQAVLNVDEEGTVAAAVTELGVAAGAAPAEPDHRLHLDRPFLMQIAASETSWPLFLAAIRDPRH
jgi:serine protease inhibitor